MIGNNSLFSSITKINEGKVIFRDNLKGKIITIGNIRDKSFPSIENFFLVNNLKNNLLSICQLCGRGYKIVTNHISCLILENDKVIYVEIKKENVYKIKIDACMRIKNCFVTIINDFFLHRRLCHISMDIISKLVKNKLVKGFPHIVFKKKNLCDA
jgi:hypothetical protein